MNREQGLHQLEQTRIIAILRGVAEPDLMQVAEALWQGGIRVMEITLNTPGALQMIGQVQKQFGEHLYIGAGTVLDLEDAQNAVEAGASFLVTPNTDEEVIHFAVKSNIPIYAGAMTPTEIVKAWKAGATAVKIFPSTGLGLPYIKELQGPFKQIPFVAVGGVNEENIRDFLSGGCHAIGIGGSLIQLTKIEEGNFSWIQEKAARLIKLAAIAV